MFGIKIMGKLTCLMKTSYSGGNSDSILVHTGLDKHNLCAFNCTYFLIHQL